jgi:excisionase family DNA binding protein
MSSVAFPDPTWQDPERIPVEQIPALLGQLEEYQAALWLRMVVTPKLTLVLPSSAPLLTVAHVAERLGLTQARVYQLIRTGELPSVAVGKKYRRVSPVDLDAWIKAQTRGAPRPATSR